MIDFEKRENEMSQVCIVCGERKSCFVLKEGYKPRRRIAVEWKHRRLHKWRDNKCPDCIREYKKNWAKAKTRESVLY